jgi:arabinogalactan oligomer/maltooligosaccharide transport system permease protein
MIKAKIRQNIRLSVVYLFLAVVSLWVLFPLWRVLSVALRPGDRLLSTTLELIPSDATLNNFRKVLVDHSLLLWLWNSLIISLSTAFLGLTFAAFSSYALSRWKFRGRNAMLIAIFCYQLLPGTAMMIASFIMILRLNLVNTYMGIIIAYSVKAVPFSIWILKGYYNTIPVEIEEAASMDGAGWLKILHKISLPLAVPALAIVFLLNFMAGWSEYLFARIILQKSELATWPLGLTRLSGQFLTSWGEFAAASLLIATPVVILYLVFSPYLISGLTLGAVEG